jgi:hypothetical protein
VTAQTLIVDVPRNLWMSANRPIANHAMRSRLINGLHTVAGWMARAQLQPVLRPCTVTWTIQYPRGTGRADPDNAYPVCKAVLDAVVQAGALADDDSVHVTGRTYTRGPNLTESGAHRVTLTIQEEP